MGTINIKDGDSEVTAGPFGINIKDGDDEINVGLFGGINITEKNKSMMSVGPEGIIIQSNLKHTNKSNKMCINNRCISKTQSDDRCFLQHDKSNKSLITEMDCEEVRNYFKQFGVKY